MNEIGVVGEAPEQAKIARAVVLHNEPPVCKCTLNNGPTLFDVPNDESPGSREFVKVLKRAARQVNPDGGRDPS